MVTVRRAHEADAQAVYEAHTRSIREICSSHYSLRETEVWASRLVPDTYLPAIRSHEFLVAEDAAGVAAFGELDRAKGEIRAIYVHPRAVRQGVGSAILSALEHAARENGLLSLHVRASLNAVPFYENAGFQAGEPSTFALTPEIAIACVMMRKALVAV